MKWFNTKQELAEFRAKLPEISGGALEIFAREEKRLEAAVSAKPLPALSQTVVNMTKNRDALTAREASLTASIDKLTEERRQARVILETLDTALHALSSDPGLTDDDRALIGVTTAGLAGAVEADDERDRRLSLAASGMSLPLANFALRP